MTETSIDTLLDTSAKSFVESLDSLKNTLIVWGLVTLNWLTTGCEIAYVFASKSLEGAMNAHLETLWVFTERNTVPWPLTEVEYRASLSDKLTHGYKYPLVYSVGTNKFSDVSSTVLEGSVFSFNDVVTAEMKNSDKTIYIDLTSTFYNLRWAAGCSPSLYEVILIHCLKNKLFCLIGKLGDFSLDILTVEAKTIPVTLNSKLCRVPFTKWDDCVEQKGWISE
jgi:hypothetical protein